MSHQSPLGDGGRYPVRSEDHRRARGWARRCSTVARELIVPATLLGMQHATSLGPPARRPLPFLFLGRVQPYSNKITEENATLTLTSLLEEFFSRRLGHGWHRKTLFGTAWCASYKPSIGACQDCQTAVSCFKGLGCFGHCQT